MTCIASDQPEWPERPSHLSCSEVPRVRWRRVRLVEPPPPPPPPPWTATRVPQPGPLPLSPRELTRRRARDVCCRCSNVRANTTTPGDLDCVPRQVRARRPTAAGAIFLTCCGMRCRISAARVTQASRGSGSARSTGAEVLQPPSCLQGRSVDATPGRHVHQHQRMERGRVPREVQRRV